MPKVLTSGFDGEELEYNPFPDNPDISSDMQRTLARLLGWSETQMRFNLIRVTENGRLIAVSAAPFVDNYTIKQINVTSIPTLAFPKNLNRQAVVFFNGGEYTAYIRYKVGDIYYSIHALFPFEEWTEVRNLNDLYLVSVGGSTTVVCVEF